VNRAASADGVSARRVDLVARDEDRGKRLDKFLNERIADLGRHQAAELCAAGHVRIDGKRAKKSAIVSPGATVSVELGEPEFLAAEPELELQVRLERPELVIVNKLSGVPSAPLKNSERGTLCGALLGRYPEMQGIGYRAREPGIVHRLDIQTSGLVLAARTPNAFSVLTHALELEAIHKRYLALVAAADLPETGEISRALAPDPAHPERVRVLEPGDLSGYARQKTTRYRVMWNAHGYTLLEVEVGSAFRHQIRAHLAAIGHPILGDVVYGGAHVPELGARHALHASQITWAGDATLEGFTVFEPLPPELARLLDD
jgi:23S rRNA pseudouridine1911/1915/1917 synthase